MTDIQRWQPGDNAQMFSVYGADEGNYVLYADHVEALRQAEQTALAKYNDGAWIRGMEKGYEQGQRDALAAAVQRVEALHQHWHDFTAQSVLSERDVIAAIKGGSDVPR